MASHGSHGESWQVMGSNGESWQVTVSHGESWQVMVSRGESWGVMPYVAFSLGKCSDRGSTALGWEGIV